ncbi:hypothetical protein ACSW3X_27205, partial [Klebsiella pneumoniae]
YIENIHTIGGAVNKKTGAVFDTKQTLRLQHREACECRVSGMEAPAEVEWSTAGNWRRRPAQPAPGSQILPVSPLPWLALTRYQQ